MVLNEAILRLYMCPLCEKAKTAYLQVFVNVNMLYWVSNDPGQNDISHVKVTVCTGWSPKVLVC